MKKMIGLAIAVIVLFGVVLPFISEAATNISFGTSKDMDRLMDFEHVQNYQINPDHPLQGILSENGVLSNTGNAIKSEGKRAGNLVEKFLAGGLILVAVGGVAAYFLLRDSDRSSRRRYY